MTLQHLVLFSMRGFKVHLIPHNVKAKVSKGAKEVTNTMQGFALGCPTISEVMHLDDIVTILSAK